MMKLNSNSYWKLLVVVIATIVVSAQYGCSSGASNDAAAKKFDELTAATSHFESLLVQVNDESTAKKFLPEMRLAVDRMVAATKAMDPTLISTDDEALNEKIEDFRLNGNTEVVRHLDRIRQIPNCKRIMRSMLVKF